MQRETERLRTERDILKKRSRSLLEFRYANCFSAYGEDNGPPYELKNTNGREVDRYVHIGDPKIAGASNEADV